MTIPEHSAITSEASAYAALHAEIAQFRSEKGNQTMSLINTAAHAFATAIADLKKSAKFIQAEVLPALKVLKADAPTIEAITGLISPQLVNVERVGEAVLGVLIQAITDAGTAANANGMSVTFDAALVADIRAIMPAVQAAAKQLLPTPVAV
jgi:hypothetical protein